MIQLTFEPALDPFHAIFRFLRLRDVFECIGPVPRDLARMLDFYLLFPFRIEGIRLKPQDRKYKSLSKAYAASKPYGEQPEDRILFSRMEPMQIAALDTLADQNFIARERWSMGEVMTMVKEPPLRIAERISDVNQADSNLINFLSVLGSTYTLLGKDGLKDRTGLLEYRYDPV
ncbi:MULTISPECIES: ABC-three component system middle component 5 [Rhodopseudomonas]|uniref:Uncharacterized protein n=1 Tax=Rhodopseudomonas palustris TaxID=1076 RepID=A0A0D7F2R1_RHOPL|nr:MULTISPECIES: ABC-three component system middle component 5 [Rhodopseudomonas]KIZ47324.1 hypothetical protein OO17_04915 [Rhodopseudomonas palustris]MDF3809318.1 hypothetical protein [Rhodopseudomonas sp. BAL398]WOK19001.1 hypothetical protein RBJ75_05635 [Rhodopseudomonas sp. BAL398]